MILKALQRVWQARVSPAPQQKLLSPPAALLADKAYQTKLGVLSPRKNTKAGAQVEVPIDRFITPPAVFKEQCLENCFDWQESFPHLGVDDVPNFFHLERIKPPFNEMVKKIAAITHEGFKNAPLSPGQEEYLYQFVKFWAGSVEAFYRVMQQSGYQMVSGIPANYEGQAMILTVSGSLVSVYPGRQGDPSIKRIEYRRIPIRPSQQNIPVSSLVSYDQVKFSQDIHYAGESFDPIKFEARVHSRLWDKNQFSPALVVAVSPESVSGAHRALSKEVHTNIEVLAGRTFKTS